MTPTPLLLVVAVFLVLVRVVWWLVARDRMFLGVPNASAAQQPDVGDCPPAVAALALSGADGGACFLLDQAASAAIANIVTQGVLAAQVHDDDALFSLRNVDDVSVDDALLIRMLRTRMTRTADGTEVVDSSSTQRSLVVEVSASGHTASEGTWRHSGSTEDANVACSRRDSSHRWYHRCSGRASRIRTSLFRS